MYAFDMDKILLLHENFFFKIRGSLPEPSTDGLGGVGEILGLRGRGSNSKSEGEVKNLNYQGYLQHKKRKEKNMILILLFVY